MLFNDPTFLFAYLPVVLLGYFLLGRLQAYRLAAGWLALASLAFYGWDDPARLLSIILSSILFNYILGRWIAARRRRPLLVLGVASNLALLGWFKYAGFVSVNLAAAGLPVPLLQVALPIGISFFTFTQIAFLVDTYRGEAKEYSFLSYVLFVTYFPHLVAGPILHHKEMMPQFARPATYHADLGHLTTGLSWFAAGIFKKVMLADTVALWADPVFEAAAKGGALSGSEAWLGTLAYTLQLYFDFSGYSDMAIGLALMMGITFPLNFFSPYKATSLIEFWRRWHMTLSRFLRDYLYIPLGGNRHGTGQRLLNLFVTMVLGGLWHGASWNFALWGAMHGLGLAANQAWRTTTVRLGIRIPALLGQGLTLLLVVLAWVPFRAGTLEAALRLWSAMLVPGVPSGPVVIDLRGWLWVAVLSAVALLLPNTAELFGRKRGASWYSWQPRTGAAVLLGLGLGLAVANSLTQPTAFLYFRF
jgi:alginate O-acetyltransferase complex protein AlgI